MPKSSLLLAVLLLGGLPSWSQPSVETILDPVNGRTVEELVQMALRRNGDALVMREQVAAAQGGLVQARLRPNPSFDVGGMQEYRGPMNSFMVGASIPLELFGRRDRRIDVAEHAINVSELDRADVERRLRAEVASKFGDVLASSRNVQFTADLLALNREALRLTEARAGEGAVPPLDASILRVEVNRLDSMRADAEARLGVVVLELKSLVGMIPDDELRLRGTLEPEPLAVAKEDALHRALKTRPDLRSLREAEEVASARLRQAQTEGRLDASLSASYQRMDSAFPLNGLTALGQPGRIQGIFHL
ncbi:MAG: TolC family protein, partial [Bryobacteraceae bacterium]